MHHTHATQALAQNHRNLGAGYEKMAEFQRQMESHISAMESLAENMLADAGNSESESQKVALKIQLESLYSHVNGTTEDDMAASSDELNAQLEYFCLEKGLPHLTAQELLDNCDTGLSQQDQGWLEHFSRRRDDTPKQ